MNMINGVLPEGITISSEPIDNTNLDILGLESSGEQGSADGIPSGILNLLEQNISDIQTAFNL